MVCCFVVEGSSEHYCCQSWSWKRPAGSPSVTAHQLTTLVTLRPASRLQSQLIPCRTQPTWLNIPTTKTTSSTPTQTARSYSKFFIWSIPVLWLGGVPAGRWSCNQQIVGSNVGAPLSSATLASYDTCASVTKQYNLVPASGRWCLVAGKVTVVKENCQYLCQTNRPPWWLSQILLTAVLCVSVECL